MLVIDEADRILEVGFEEEMKRIVNILPKGTSSLRSSKPSGVLIFVRRGPPVDALLSNTNNKSYRPCPNIAKARSGTC